MQTVRTRQVNALLDGVGAVVDVELRPIKGESHLYVVHGERCDHAIALQRGHAQDLDDASYIFHMESGAQVELEVEQFWRLRGVWNTPLGASWHPGWGEPIPVATYA